MRTAIAFILGISLTLAGCDRERQPQTQAPASPAPSASGSAQHVRLSMRDMTLELQKHCEAAGESMKRLSAAADKARSSDSGSGKAALAAMDAPLRDMQRDMATCLAMVHGIYEQQVGEDRKPPTGTRQP